MNKLRGSAITKMVLWILCIVSAISAAILGIITIIGIQENFFGKTMNEAMKGEYEYANATYSFDAYMNRNVASYGKMLAENGFEFGIIESQSLKGIDFNNSSSYIAANMTEDKIKALNWDELFLYRVTVYDNGSEYGRMMGYYGDYDDISVLDVDRESDDSTTKRVYLYADSICYDMASGIIYYHAEATYYPVRNVSLQYYSDGVQTLYNYSYDFDQSGYKLNYMSPYVRVNGASEYSLPVIQEVPDGEMEQIETILKGSGTGSIVDLSELNDTSFSYDNWGLIVLDSIRDIYGDKLTLIDSGIIDGERFYNEPGYYINENYTLVVDKKVSRNDYWVVSLVPESVSDKLSGSRYNETQWFINLFYTFDSNVVPMLCCSILMAVVFFVLLACAAGYRKNKEGIILTLVDRIPLDVLSIIVCGIEFLVLFIGIAILESIDIAEVPYLFMWMAGMTVFVMAVAGIWYLLSLCVRVKNGKWWRNSICYRIFSFVRDIVLKIFRNINLLWKVILIICVISFAEFMVIAETDTDFIVICWAIEKLVLCTVFLKLVIQIYELQKASRKMAEGNLAYKVNTSKMFWECKKHGENLNKIGEGMSKAVDERMKSERFKTELITNVSHDIKTPLTSIINYVDLLEKEELNNEKASEYLEVLERQSSKLKKLIEDLVEASKASSGNMAVSNECLEVGVFITQTIGEFEERLSHIGLELIINKPDDSVYIMADGRHLWRVADNLMNNICKYAQQGTRVYVNLEASERRTSITFRNMSHYPLNINGEELMERFVRGDKSRNTEGHGLGLSIAQSLMKLMGGDMNIVVDGDLFKVIITFNRYYPRENEGCENAEVDFGN